MSLPDAWRHVKLLRDHLTEHFQHLLTILFAKDLPQVLQGDPLAQTRCWWKKTPFRLSGMGLLLEWCCVWPRTNPRASRARRRIVPERLAKGQCIQVRGSSVCPFWGEQKHLDALLQAYTVERAKAEARRKGHQVTEAKLTDGSIKLTISVGGAA